MSERLKAAMQDYKNRNGRRWKEKLSLAADVSTSLLEKIQAGQSTSSGYAVAVACGCDHKEATQIAAECLPEAKVG